MSTALTTATGKSANQGSVAVSMDTVQGFEALQRIAKLFTASEIVPLQYQGEKGLPNAVIAVDMAFRMAANPLMVMQNLYVVHNRPGWSAQFLIATFNKCGRFSSIRYDFQGEAGKDDWGCCAVTTELSSGEVLRGPLVTIKTAKDEGWYTKNGSKWPKLPELMLRYRAATFLIRTVAPEIAMGLQTKDEIEDTVEMEQLADGTYTSNNDTPTANPLAQGRNSLSPRASAAKPPAPEQEPPADKPAGTSSFLTAADKKRRDDAYAILNRAFDENPDKVDDLLAGENLPSFLDLDRNTFDTNVIKSMEAIAKLLSPKKG